MKISILKKTEKPLLSRTEIYGEIEFTGKTPSNEEVSKKVAETIKASNDVLVVKGITQIYGANKAKVFAYIYKDADSLREFEPVKKEKEGQKEKAAGQDDKKEEKAGKEGKKEENPKEAKQGKEETKPGEKK